MGEFGDTNVIQVNEYEIFHSCMNKAVNINKDVILYLTDVLLALSVLQCCCWSSKNCLCTVHLSCFPHPGRWLSGTAPV